VNPWLIAARPPTLLASVAPVLVGGGLAIGDGVFRADAFVVTLVTAVLLNVAVNFANDASDARRGADGPHRIGPARVVATGLLTARQVWIGTAVVLALAVAGGAYLAWISGWPILAIGAAAIVAALAYTGGPRPYGYFGLGEVFVFGFFGVAAVVGSRYIHDATTTDAARLLSLPVGFLVTAILVANNVRDIDTDRDAGKRTLAVRLGRDRTRVLFATLVWGAFALIAVFAALELTPRWTALGLLALPLTIRPVRVVRKTEAGPALIGALRATARLHFVVGVLVGVGAAVS
jgi:1,4-dihydroxy-2-naphthoate octaprenyltransferase